MAHGLVGEPLLYVLRNTDEPVYEQIARPIRKLIASGELAAGMPLPTVRTLASDLGINLNTVARAYWRLEEEGFIQIHNRSGAENPTAQAQARRRSKSSG